jgi:serine/threonine-protein kinase
MATVYLARDLKHDRQVAIKVLRPELAATLGSERFLREIQIVARLNHPHILQLHDSGEAAGFLYFVMPFVEGESLRQRLDREGPLPVETAVRLADEIAGALEYAHQHGVVHRDIKPENILLQTDHAVVSDFGIARAVDAAVLGGSGGARLTETGLAIGTPLYMSPEQVSGDPVDGRTDIYSLGCVLYEMVEGVPPFDGPSPIAVAAKHSMAPVPPLRRSGELVSRSLQQAIFKALAKAPQERFAGAAEFRAALMTGSPAPDPASRAWPGRRVAVLAAAGIALLAAAVLWSRRPRAAPAATGAESIAVLAFRNVGGDSADEPFSDGVSEEITTALGKVPGLRVEARSRAFGFKGKDLASQEVGRRLNVSYVLDGGVRQGGSRRRVSVQLINVADGTEVWSEEYDQEAEDRDVFAVQDSIARAVVVALRVHLSGAARAALSNRSTENPEAHDLYLKGRYFWNQRGANGPVVLGRAIGFFQQAIALDSGYARAWAGLADAYSMLPAFGNAPPGEAFARARAAAERAVALDSTLADAYTSLGIINVFHDWDWNAARRNFDRALSLDSTESHTHLFRAWLLTSVGQFDSATAEVRTALRLDPLNGVINTRLGSVLVQNHHYAEAESVYRQALALDSTNVGARSELGLVLALQRRFAEALPIYRTLQDTVDLNRQGGWLVASLNGYVAGSAGHHAEALRLKRYLEQLGQTHYVMPVAVANIAIGVGDTAGALDWLERAYQERSFMLIFLGWPMYDGLRDQPRFQAIFRGMHLTLPPLPAPSPR